MTKGGINMKFQKRSFVLMALFFFVVAGCTSGMENEEQKIKVQTRIAENKYEDFKEITKKEEVRKVKKIIEKADWENAIVNMVERADYRFVFQYKNADIEAKAVLYELWISPNKDKVELVKSDNEYVQLNEENSAVLLEILTGEKLADKNSYSATLIDVKNR